MMDEQFFQKFQQSGQEVVKAWNALSRIFVRTMRPVLKEMTRAYTQLPREVKVAVKDRRATPIMLKKIRRAIRQM